MSHRCPGKNYEVWTERRMSLSPQIQDMGRGDHHMSAAGDQSRHAQLWELTSLWGAELLPETQQNQGDHAYER